MQEFEPGVPLYYLPKNPQGWVNQSLMTFRKSHYSDQSTRWVEQTGVKPEDSSFTLVVPIHNEERFLSSFLGTLMLTDIPNQVSATLVFVTNDCQDHSQEIIGRFLSQIGTNKEESWDGGDIDPRVNCSIRTACLNRLRFLHLNTPTSGKANSLNIGNELALRSGHRICMSIDANNFVQPESVRAMFAAAYDHIIRAEDDTKVLFARSRKVLPRRSESTFTGKILRKAIGLSKQDNTSQTRINGWFLAWDSSWLKNVGGVPQVAMEDYALGLRTIVDGKQIKEVEDAIIWGYSPDNLQDVLQSYSRAARGGFQIISNYPDLAFLTKQDFYCMKSPGERLKVIREGFISNPRKIPFILGKCLVWELARSLAVRDFRADPTNQSWEPISSTK